ncbi:retrovirus-related Pol polyprotein from transposon opus [Trichonephila clavipes]|uniref:RNA-directed DNA polymerase n=1 Tax=Trichonephila clavipes TaxID=2585209 RepID=A0A8X6T078_TRICX|nr:retrovirus-related Pol polyprotein from transposon opus [Trichonephila clavipes]
MQLRLQRFIDSIIRDIPCCYAYVDDLLITSADHESHKRDLDLVFSKLGEHGIIVNPQKCVFGQSELKFLGFLVSSNGAAEEQACLHDLVKYKVKRDNTPVVWNDVTNSAFESCKKLITNATALSFPAAIARLSLMTDASDFAVGSVLQQHIETTVEPLGFFLSRKLSATEKKYSTFDRELLSIYLSVKHFRHMLEGREPIHTFSRISQIDLLNSNDYSRLSEDKSSDLELQSLMGSATGLELGPVYFAHSDKTFYCDVSMATVRPYVTKQFRRQIFNQLHNLSHPGVKATQKLISARFVWKNLNKDCALWCKSCTQCQRSKVSRHTKSPVGTFPLPSARFSNVHIDVVGSLSPVREMSYLLTCVDRFTR